MPKITDVSIGEYLLKRLYDHGIRHIFGIPGDYVLRFYNLIEDSKIKHVGTTREDAAGFAADAYARIKGMGAVCVTYCVGGLNLTNPIAGAYAEKSPVVVISGGPGTKEREKNPLLHHKVKDFTTQKEVFEKITVASAILDDPLIAISEIDRCFEAAVKYKRPIYLELPRDMVDIEAHIHRPPKKRESKSDPLTLREAIAEAVAMINSSQQPVILADVEMHRFGLQDQLAEFAEKFNIPVAATLLGKSVIAEDHPLYIGIYEGAMGKASVQKFVEDSDCVIMLGAFMTDINLGIYTAHLDQGRSIYATSEKISIRHHRYEDIDFKDFINTLLEADMRKRKYPNLSKFQPPKPKEDKVGLQKGIKPEAPITVKRLFEMLNSSITEDIIVISDIGDCLFGAADLVIHRRTEFLSPAYYASMGFGVPAAIGAQLAAPKHRVLVLVGDGAFQMTGLELSTSVRLGLNPIVIVLNNHGYSTERHIQDGPYNDILDWQYSRIPEILGMGKGFVVKTEGEFKSALANALANTESFSILDVHLDKYDKSPALQRLAERLAKKV